jgi:hypothetical protein
MRQGQATLSAHIAKNGGIKKNVHAGLLGPRLAVVFLGPKLFRVTRLFVLLERQVQLYLFKQALLVQSFYDFITSQPH